MRSFPPFTSGIEQMASESSHSPPFPQHTNESIWIPVWKDIIYSYM